jgi:hypothetical protein
MRLGTKIPLLVATFCSTSIFGQMPNTSTVDIYANFVGTWIGTNHFLKDGVDTRHLVRVEITETKKHDAIICNYTYGKKGEKGFDHRSLRITLNPLKSEMTLLWNNEDTNHLKTSGLDSFAATGLGTFTGAFTAASNQMISASETTYEVLFHLEKDSYNYEWRSGRKGQALVLESVFSLKRETTSISPPSAPSGHTP